jgi:hypothetical protein
VFLTLHPGRDGAQLIATEMTFETPGSCMVTP